MTPDAASECTHEEVDSVALRTKRIGVFVSTLRPGVPARSPSDVAPVGDARVRFAIHGSTSNLFPRAALHDAGHHVDHPGRYRRAGRTREPPSAKRLRA